MSAFASTTGIRGALVVANSPAEKRDLVFKRLTQWGMSMVVIAPPIAWLAVS